MSFITKRERVFNECDLYDLPSRNEGKLKAYASCTDARAWSHFCSDKTEHLVEIIKRNNEKCAAKYLPTSVIVDTLMAPKNRMIACLKRKIEEFEQMLFAYDQLDLTCAQKCEIANAHATIKAANKELDDLCLDLDLSGFTEGMESEAYETGKSRGDEPDKYKEIETSWSKGTDSQRSGGDEWANAKESPRTENKSNQVETACTCDASTSAHDPRLAEMQDSIIAKDAKLNAMQNTIAVMENDVCEPYCIYAHIYTALEKIFAILCQNEKYKLYLSFLTNGKDTRSIDIRGKILFKLKVFEKFCLALIAPCSQEMKEERSADCCCFRAEVISRIETTLALTSAESQGPGTDTKRAQLIADIMDNEEMKDILKDDLKGDLPKEESTDKAVNEQVFDEDNDNYSIDIENLKRLKSLQDDYDDLMNCYENLKHEKEYLQQRNNNCEELEKELEQLRNQLRDYNTLWNEKEHYKSRSEDLENLREKFFLLANETSSIETQLKAESEINNIKTDTISQLRLDNLALEKKLNDTSIEFERDKNNLECKLKEMECQSMCQSQQIRSLSTQIDKLIEQDFIKVQTDGEGTAPPVALIDEIDSLKEQIRNLKESLMCNEDEKQQLQKDFEEKLKTINDLKMEVEDWKSNYNRTIQRKEYLEKVNENMQDSIQKLMDENRNLSQEVEERSNAVDNLMAVINNKSQEINRLSQENDAKGRESKDLVKQLNGIKKQLENNILTLETEKDQALSSLQLARKESEDLLEKVKDYDDTINKQRDLVQTVEIQAENNKFLNDNLLNLIEKNKQLEAALLAHEREKDALEMQNLKLQEVNNLAIKNIDDLRQENSRYNKSLELSNAESRILHEKIKSFDKISHEIDSLSKSHSDLLEEKKQLEKELTSKIKDLDDAKQSIQLSKKESDHLLGQLRDVDIIKEDLIKLNRSYQNLVSEKGNLLEDLEDKNKKIDNLLTNLNNLKKENEILSNKSHQFDDLQSEFDALQKKYNDLLNKNHDLQENFKAKSEEMKNWWEQALKDKMEENRLLACEVDKLKRHQDESDKSLEIIKSENKNSKVALEAARKESSGLIDKVKHYEKLEKEFNDLKHYHDDMHREKERLQKELDRQLADLQKMESENRELNNHSQHLINYGNDLEQALINSRNQMPKLDDPSPSSYVDILKDIENMKKEQIANHHKVRNLMNQLAESDDLIQTLNEQVFARDNRIAILENHINELEDEVRKVHDDLEAVINTSQQIKKNSSEKIDQSLKRMEAHHSKATHNMKMELAKLQNENATLGEQLSISKLKHQDSYNDIKNCASQIANLLNEREIIVTDIKQIEMKSVGDSNLSPENCGIEDISASLDRIRKFIDATNTKSFSLEQSLLKMQSSSQMLLNKADETKKIVEKEKQKVINEKEEAIKERQNMERQLATLKEQLKQQLSQDNTIKEKEAEILNQKLIIDKINMSRQSHISKLEDDMQALQELYQNALRKNSELENQIHTISKDNDQNVDLIKKLRSSLEDKSEDLKNLQEELRKLKNKPVVHKGVETYIPDDKDVISQTEYFKSVLQNNKTQTEEAIDKNQRETMSEYKVSKIKPNSVNEVQVLTASIGPPLQEREKIFHNENATNIIPSSSTATSENLQSQVTNDDSHHTGKTYTEPARQDNNLIDIYNRKTPLISDSNIFDTDRVRQTKVPKHGRHSPSKSNARTELPYDSHTQDNLLKSNNTSSPDIFKNTLSHSSDLLEIYNDSQSNSLDKSLKDKRLPISNRQPDVADEPLSLDIAKNIRWISTSKAEHKIIRPKEILDYEDFYMDEDDEDSEIIKNQLSITIPRVDEYSHTNMTSDIEKRSSHSNIDEYDYTISERQPDNTYDIDTNITRDSPYLRTTSFDKPYTESKDSKPIKIKSAKKTRTTLQQPIRVETKSSQNKELRPQKKDLVSQNRDPELHKKDSSSQKRDAELHKRIPKPHNQDTELQKRNAELPTRNPELQKTNNFQTGIHTDENESHHELTRIGADVLLVTPNTEQSEIKHSGGTGNSENFGLQYILDSVQDDVHEKGSDEYNKSFVRGTKSDETFNQNKPSRRDNGTPSKLSSLKISSTDNKIGSILSPIKLSDKSFDRINDERHPSTIEEYENKIKRLSNTLENIEKDYKKKIDVIKTQYDNNIKNIINEHNQGVKNIQGLHEETLQDILKVHENEVDNLRSMSIEAMKKAEKLEKENQTLKYKIRSSSFIDEEPVKITSDIKKRELKHKEVKTLTKTELEAFDVKPKTRPSGPCTCTLDVNISDTIRNIFDQVDAAQRKSAETTYLKFIAKKILQNSIEVLDANELTFLHLKVCRIWKSKLSKEEALQKRIDSLESEVICKQRNAQQQIIQLERKVAEERRRLHEVREAVCRVPPPDCWPIDANVASQQVLTELVPPERDLLCDCSCNATASGRHLTVNERRSAGDLVICTGTTVKTKRTKGETNRATLTNLDCDYRKDRKLYSDEPPTRLRRSHDRAFRCHKRQC